MEVLTGSENIAIATLAIMLLCSFYAIRVLWLRLTSVQDESKGMAIQFIESINEHNTVMLQAIDKLEQSARGRAV